MTPLSVFFLSVKARAIDSAGGFEAVQLLPAATAGLRAGQMQNAAVCPVLIWYPFNNARARGKTFLPGVTDNDLVGGTYANGFKSTVATQAPLLANPIVLGGGGAPTATMVIRQTKPVYSLLPIQYANLSDSVGTLRRRQRPA